VQLSLGNSIDNSDLKESTFKTEVGGCISLVIYGLWFFFVQYYFNQMISNQNN